MPKSNRIARLPEPTPPPQQAPDGLTFTMAVDLDDVARAVLEELRASHAHPDTIRQVEAFLADEDR